MQIDFFHLTFETPLVSFHLWSPWRAAEIEHRLFTAIKQLPRVEAETSAEEWRLLVRDPKVWKSALVAVSRVLKGWQEEADPGGEKRVYRWMLEADADGDGYDHSGEPIGLWGFLRMSLERGGPGDADRGEDLDLHGFSFKIWCNGTQPTRM